VVRYSFALLQILRSGTAPLGRNAECEERGAERPRPAPHLRRTPQVAQHTVPASLSAPVMCISIGTTPQRPPRSARRLPRPCPRRSLTRAWGEPPAPRGLGVHLTPRIVRGPKSPCACVPTPTLPQPGNVTLMRQGWTWRGLSVICVRLKFRTGQLSALLSRPTRQCARPVPMLKGLGDMGMPSAVSCGTISARHWTEMSAA
jgi:hypothetical protein